MESCSETFIKLFNNTLLTSSFRTYLEIANISTVFQKDDPSKAKNYRAVSMLTKNLTKS